MLYNYSRELLKKYENDKEGELKSVILCCLCCCCFKNADVLPSKIDIIIDLKPYIKQVREYRKGYSDNKKYVPIWEYPAQMIECVLSDLELEFTSLYVVGHRGFNYTFEVSFPKDTIENYKICSQ